MRLVPPPPRGLVTVNGADLRRCPAQFRRRGGDGPLYLVGLPSENPRGGAGQGLGALSAWRVLKSKRARPRSATCFLPRRSGLGRPGRQCEVTRGDRRNVVSVTPESIYQRRRNPGIASHEFGVVQVTSFPGRRGSRPSRPGTRREARRLAPRPAIAAVRTARASCRARKPKPAASRSGGPLCLRDEGRRGPSPSDDVGGFRPEAL